MRIFWLGMHKLLVRTELPRLRQLGFEVFNPPYLSRIKDQSAELNWDAAQPTTLPAEVFKALSEYNFFYEPISPEIAELLNAYFDAVVVTINPDWLTEVLKVFKKRIIYRAYGQTYPLSEHLWNNGAGPAILDHPDFHFVPFHALSVDLEHTWLASRMTVVPYQIDDDVIAEQDTWRVDVEPRQEIMLTCPNIENPFYGAHYQFLKQHFPDPRFRFYGVQFSRPDDPQIVGTLPRADILRSYRAASGYLYTHGGPMVSYLPPIEMMTVGGPVLYLPHSLLARFFGANGPGLARDPEQARIKANRLLDGDRSFIEDVVASQAPVRRLYHPDYVNSIFDPVMRKLLAPPPRTDAPAHIVNNGAATSVPAPRAQKRIYVLFHFPGGIIGRRDHLYLSAEGIPRVIRLMVNAILAASDCEVVITSTYANAPFTMGFFGVEETSRIKIHVIDDVPAIGSSAVPGPTQKFASFLDRIGRLLGPLGPKLHPIGQALVRAASGLFRVTGVETVYADTRVEALANAINQDADCLGVLVPHYYLFPEAQKIDAPIALYLPDYTPHFYEGTTAFAKENRHAGVGRAIADRATVVMTNSQFTRSYISDTVLKVDLAKVQVFPLPNLNKGVDQEDEPSSSLVREHVRFHANGRPIIFYPTQNRPNKNIPRLLQILAKLLERHAARGGNSKPPVLVLTCNLDDFAPARTEFERLNLASHVVFVSAATDDDLRWIYRQAVCLALTTEMEGNFPPQVVEALSYGTPVVASRIPLITEELGQLSDHVLLVETTDVTGFVEKIEYAMTHRAKVLEGQAKAHEFLMAARTPEKFNAALGRVVASLREAAKEKAAGAIEPTEAYEAPEKP